MANNQNFALQNEGLFNTDELAFQQSEGITNQNKTQQDASTENEVHVIPHKDIKPEDNQALAKLDKQNIETPTINDSVYKDQQVDQEGNVITAGAEKQAKEEKKEPLKTPDLFGMTSANAAEIEKNKSEQDLKDLIQLGFAPTSILEKNVFTNVYKRAMGQNVPENENGIFGKVVLGLTDFSIKTVTSGFSLAKEINNSTSKNGLIMSPEKIAEIEKYYNDSLFGKINTEVEKEAKESAVAKLTSEIAQLYFFAKTGTQWALGGYSKLKGLLSAEENIASLETAEKLTNDYVKAVKNNKAIIPNENIAKAYEKVSQLNNLSRGEKFGVAVIGGSVGAAMIADYQDVGTAVLDLFGYGMDTEVKNDSQEDAVRRLTNRFKFGLDNAFITVPLSYGLGKIGELIAEQGKDLAFSDSKLDRLIDKVASGFRSRGVKSSELFEATTLAEGQIKVAKNTARDLIIDINKTLSRISDTSGIAKGEPAWQTMMEKLNNFLIPQDNKIINGKVVFDGFNVKQIKDFDNFAKETKLEPETVDALKSQLISARNQFNTFINTMLGNGNVQVNAKEFNQIMSDRIKNMFTSDYKIFTEKNSIVPMLNYKPTDDTLKEAGNILSKYAADNGVNLTKEQLEIQMQDILKNVKLDPLTKTPQFIINNFSVLDDTATQIIKIADNFKGGKFKPSKFFKSEKSLNSYLELFGQKNADIRNTIANTMSDLGTLAAKDNFYKGILEKSDQLLANGERSILYPDRLSAQNPEIGLKNQNIITDKNGLQIESPLGAKIYTNPINGKFTSELYRDALTFNEKMAFDSLSKNVWYRNLVLIPKSIVQMNKTIFDQFTHMKVFVANNLFSLGNGNFFVDPRKVMSSFKEAFNALQPQLLYRNTPKDLQLYNFLLERGVVYSSSTAQDLKGLFKDLEDGGSTVLNKIFNRFGNGVQKLAYAAHDSYMAGDDIMKIYNFLVENYKYRNAYSDLLKTGKITELEIMDKAAKIAANTLPNYNFVGSFVRGLRRTPFGNFPSFHSEVIRTGGNVIELGLQEAKNPIEKWIGVRRLLGFGLATSVAVPLISQVVRGAYGITTDMVNAVKEFVPSYSKGSQLIVYQDKEGNFKYIDASSGFVYDAFVGPAQSAIAGIESNKTFDENATTMQGIRKGLGDFLMKAKNPYLDESIWFGTFNDLFIRKGVTQEGYRIWNPQAPLGDKILKAIEYVSDKIAPFGWDRDKRIYHAITQTPGPRGEKYDTLDELGVMVGARSIKLDPLAQMPYVLDNYKKKFNDSRSLFTGETLKGGVITTDDIVLNWIKANAAAYNIGNEIYKKKQAANILGVTNQELLKVFETRQEGSLFKSLQMDRFKPIDITVSQQKEIKQEYKKIINNFEDLEYTMPYDPSAIRIINQLKNTMRRIPYGENFYDYIDPKDWLTGSNDQGSLQTPVNNINNKQVFNIAPVNTPNVNPQTVTPNPQQTSATQNEFQRAFPQG
jgi:hypothetical protein